MSVPRCEVVDPFSVQILHVYNRCVRRSFLCGVDSVSGKDYSHRKDWIRQRLEFLTGIFAFDIATYAVMSNHFHLVVRSRPDIVASWSDQEVAIRNMRLQGKKWFRSDGTPRQSADAEIERIISDPEEIQRLRRKLSDISKLMMYFDRNLAVRANQEDKVDGAFWEGTFKIETIEDEASLLACMTYVDLNPVRAMMANTLEESEYTGASDRINELRRQLAIGKSKPVTTENGATEHYATEHHATEQPEKSKTEYPSLSSQWLKHWERSNQPGIGWLAPIQLDERCPVPDVDSSGRRPSRQGFLSMSLLHYLEIAEWTGRQIRSDKPGAISEDAPSILEQLGIKSRDFIEAIRTQSTRDRYFAATERKGVPERTFSAIRSA